MPYGVGIPIAFWGTALLLWTCSLSRKLRPRKLRVMRKTVNRTPKRMVVYLVQRTRVDLRSPDRLEHCSMCFSRIYGLSLPWFKFRCHCSGRMGWYHESKSRRFSDLKERSLEVTALQSQQEFGHIPLSWSIHSCRGRSYIVDDETFLARNGSAQSLTEKNLMIMHADSEKRMLTTGAFGKKRPGAVLWGADLRRVGQIVAQKQDIWSRIDVCHRTDLLEVY